MSKFDYSDLKYYTIMEGSHENKCRVCGDETKYIDYCCECAICSTECYSELMNRMTNEEQYSSRKDLYMGYIGDYKADTWMVIEKIYRDNQLSEYNTSALDLKEFNEVCEHIKTIVGTYVEDFESITHPRKSVYILEKENFKLVIKAIKI